MLHRCIAAAVGLGLVVPSFAHAEDVVKTDRYTLVALSANDYEKDPLSVPVSMVFPPTVATVGEAVNYALRDSGWEFVSFPEDKALNLTLSRPLPKIHRGVGLMSIRDLLQVLVGHTYEPVEDPVRRLYSFDLKTSYQGIVSNE